MMDSAGAEKENMNTEAAVALQLLWFLWRAASDDDGRSCNSKLLHGALAGCRGLSEFHLSNLLTEYFSTS